VTIGPVTIEEVRRRLGGAPSATDDDLTEALDTAVAHIEPLLRESYRDRDEWPDDLHDGVLLAAVLTYRNAESPHASPGDRYGSGADEGAEVIVPPIAWDPRVRHRLAQYYDPGVWVG
jgi:hypothetical protein